MEREPALRVAIVGVGPKGTFALERLLAHAGERASLSIDLYEPHPAPGAGPVYDPSQPDYLRMNFAAEAVDMWWRDGDEPDPDRTRLSFVEWRREGDDRYPPRAQVGCYLNEGFEELLASASAGTRIELRACRVLGAEPTGGGWRLRADDGIERDYDEVLVAVGHTRGGAPRRGEHAAIEHIAEVFPVTSWVGRVPAGATVAVRGFALTFIDAALALTEGRGGEFRPVAGHPFRLRYEPSGREPAAILPHSRSGRPILAKADPQPAAGLPALEALASGGREAVLRLPDDLDLTDDFLPLLGANAASVLAAATGGEGRFAEAMDWLARAARGEAPDAGGGAVEEIERSLEIGSGMRTPDLVWALGHSWRTLYPAIVERFGGDGLDERSWAVFRRMAVQLERISFGPPPLNAAKLLALVEAGQVDLGELTSDVSERDGAVRLGDRRVDVTIDAVLPEPGARGATGLLEELLDRGSARVIAGRRGLDVEPDGTCVGRDGAPIPGLAAIGRPTEDSVIGNDTLSRTLHPLSDRWGRRVAARAPARAPAPTA